MKGYIARWAFEGEGDVHYWFSISPEGAATWAWRDVAKVHLQEFNRKGVTIPSSVGGTYTIRNFAIEERIDGKFVLCCEAPFLVQNPSDLIHPARHNAHGLTPRRSSQPATGRHRPTVTRGRAIPATGRASRWNSWRLLRA